jgi:hypothetical protein
MNSFVAFIVGVGLMAVVICIVTAGAVWYLYKYKMNPSGKIDINTRRVDCSRCTSGTQAKVNGEWGPIPMEMRTVQDGVFTFEAPLANTRKCTRCMGRGWFPQDVRAK